MKKFGVGQPLRRVEDVRFLKGEGRYTSDYRFENEAVGYVLRSPYAHADISSLDLTEAKAAPGVIDILTIAEMDAAGVGVMPCSRAIENSDGTPIALTERWILARDRVRFVGDPVAFIIAESLREAKDAAERVEIEYEPLDAAGTIEAACRNEAPDIWPEAPGNLAFDWDVGDKAAVETAFQAADHITKVTLINNRLVPNPIEPRAAIGMFDPEAGHTLYTNSQGVAGLLPMLGEIMPNAVAGKLNIITPDVGGGFGMKMFTYPEHVMVLVAAERTGRPVRWTGDRSEAFLADTHGRDILSDVELALDADGHFLAYRVSSHANLGGYLSEFGPFIPTLTAVQVLGGVYKIPHIHVRVRGVMTNTAPVDAYRGAGRPEAAYMLERAVNQAAAELGLGQDEIRARNFIPPDAFPYKNATDTILDSGDFARNMKDAKAHAGWDGFEERRADALARGRLRGIGMAYYMECTLGLPSEEVEVRFTSEDRVELLVGTQSNGQGHETTFPQLIAEKLGIDPDKVDLVQGDTKRKNTGGGTAGSRSLHMISGATLAACDDIIGKGKELAAHIMDVPGEDVEFADGVFTSPKVNMFLSVFDLLREANERNDLPAGLPQSLDSKSVYTKTDSTFPNGCHVAEVEIDPETGSLKIVDYTVADDFGRIVNPLIVAGQVHGGVVQGLGQALLENCVYDGESGQLMTGSFMDYGLPRADDASDITFHYNEILCQTNPLGVKGCGEAGTIGAAPAIMNAILDALKERGIRHIDMPATPHKIWRALAAANGG